MENQHQQSCFRLLPIVIKRIVITYFHHEENYVWALYYLPDQQSMLMTPRSTFNEAIEYAAYSHWMEGLEFLRIHQQRGQQQMNEQTFCSLVVRGAASGGHLDIGVNAMTNHNHSQSTVLELDILIQAGSGGHLHITQWAYEHRLSAYGYDSEAAALHGHIGTLKWLQEKNHFCWELAAHGAVLGNQQHILDWLEEIRLAREIQIERTRPPDGLRLPGHSWSDALITIKKNQKHIHLIPWLKARGAEQLDLNRRYVIG